MISNNENSDLAQLSSCHFFTENVEKQCQQEAIIFARQCSAEPSGGAADKQCPAKVTQAQGQHGKSPLQPSSQSSTWYLSLKAFTCSCP